MKSVFEDHAYFDHSLIVQEKVQALVDKLFDEACILCQCNQMVFLLIPESYYKGGQSQVYCDKTVFDENSSDGFEIWLQPSGDSSIAVLLLQPTNGVRLLYRIVFDVFQNDKRFLLDFLFI